MTLAAAGGACHPGAGTPSTGPSPPPDHTRRSNAAVRGFPARGSAPRRQGRGLPLAALAGGPQLPPPRRGRAGRADWRMTMVFSTYAPWSVHEIAREAKRRGLARRWIADFRDEVGTAFAWQKGKKARYLRMLRREADVLCAASQGFLEMMGFEDVGRVLSNGFLDRRTCPGGGCARTHGQAARDSGAQHGAQGRRRPRPHPDVSCAGRIDQARSAGAQPGGAGVCGRRKRSDAASGRACGMGIWWRTTVWSRARNLSLCSGGRMCF